MRFNRWKKAALAVVVVAAAAGTGAAWAGTTDNPTGQAGPVTPAPSGGGDRLIGTGTNDVKFVPVTPCRLVDTRVHDQRLAANQTRTFDVRGAGTPFAAQGGKTGGCGIPGSVTAVEVTVTAVDSGGNGFLRVYPDTVPAASFLNFNASANLSNTGTVAICGHSGGLCVLNADLRVRAYGAATDVVIDISGYYARPLAGYIAQNGSITRGSRILSVTPNASDGTPGTYNVTFDRDVSACVYNVTPGYFGYMANAVPATGRAATVFVKIVNHANVDVAVPFNIEVTC